MNLLRPKNLYRHRRQNQWRRHLPVFNMLEKEKVSMVTWNASGLRDDANRATTFAYLRQLGADIIALQETHTGDTVHSRWTEQWGGPAVWTEHVGLLLRPDSHIFFASDPVALLGGRVMAAEVKGGNIPFSSLFYTACTHLWMQLSGPSLFLGFAKRSILVRT